MQRSMADKRPREEGKGKEQGMDIVKANEMHTYVYVAAECSLLPDLAPCTPFMKKGKIWPTLSELQDNIVRLVAEKIKKSAENLAMMKRNADSIEDLKDTSEVLFKELQDMKKRCYSH
ncbi:hypothetical protein ATANTOWER_024631 [Ataeniobius toweri]|uniref:Uncharacterized protein n=1 Tax=Ataeniobius toweri TaxID=208326 RepID=A0ABU7CCM1_9TELE|nr:hypothetical protein [Ataeniobius toweri]